MNLSINNINRIRHKYLSYLDYTLCFFLAISIPIATSFHKNDLTTPFHILILEVIATFVTLILFFIILRILLEKIANPKKIKQKTTKFSVLLSKIFDSKRNILLISLIIFLFWLPVLFSLYPGTMINDSWGQLVQTLALKDGSWIISSHHPVFDTFIMSVVILPIANITGNWHLGFFFYIIIQSICTSITFAYTIVYMKNKFKQNNRTSFIFLLLYCLSPILISSVQTISKDALSAWIYVLFIIEFIEIIRTKNAVFKNKRFLLIFITTCIFCILTKKTATYIIGGSLISTLIFQKENRKFIFFSLLSIGISAFLIIPIIQSVFNIKPSGLQEMFSLPFQQTAFYVKNYPNDSSEEEKEIIDAVLDYNHLAERYNPLSADYVKGYSQKGKTKDYLRYITVWLKQGLKQPINYLESASKHLSGWFSYSIYKPLTNMEHHGQLNPSLIPENTYKRSDFFSFTTKIFEIIYESFYNIPILGIILTFAFNASILPAFILCTFYIRRKKTTTNYLLVYVPFALSLIIGCYLAPVSVDVHFEGVRYLYPITYTTPLFLMLATSLYSKKHETS